MKYKMNVRSYYKLDCEINKKKRENILLYIKNGVKGKNNLTLFAHIKKKT